MDWTQRFDRLTALQALAVAAMEAERVLPLAGSLRPLEDGLRLVWMQAGGRPTTKQELAGVLNAAIEAVHLEHEPHSAGEHAACASIAVIESALHNPSASLQAVESALLAVRALEGGAFDEEVLWLEWALAAAALTEVPTRATFQDANAPVCKWSAKMSAADLPIFGTAG